MSEFGYTEKDLNDLTKDKDSHTILTNTLKDQYYNHNRNFGNLFNDLAFVKKMRIQADYKIEFVSLDNTNEVRRKSTIFKNSIKNI